MSNTRSSDSAVAGGHAAQGAVVSWAAAVASIMFLKESRPLSFLFRFPFTLLFTLHHGACTQASIQINV